MKPMHRESAAVRRNADGSIDTRHYLRRGRMLHARAVRDALVRLAVRLRIVARQSARMNTGAPVE